MSLVNKVLRDLDARRASAEERAALPAAVTPLAAHSPPRGSLAGWWLGMVLLAGLAIAAWYATEARQAEAPAAPPSIRVPVAMPAVPVPTAPAPAAAAPAPTAPLPAGSGAMVAAAPGFKAEATSALVRKADQLSAAPVPAAPRRKPAAPVAVTPKAKVPDAAKAASVALAASVPGLPAANTEPPRPKIEVLPKAPPGPGESSIDKQARSPSPAERAEAEYRRGVLALRHGTADDAVSRFRAALEDYPEHAAARQTLAAVLIDAKHFDEAEELLRKGTELAKVRLASTLALARLKVERNQGAAALELLQKNAASGERSAEYQGFAGALLNRSGRAAEAVEHYQAATRLAPNEGRWWAGLGIALEAMGKPAEAREAYQKGRALPGLPADLALHIEQRLR